MKRVGGYVLAALIAGVVGLLATFVIGNVLLIPLTGYWYGRTVVLGPLSIVLLLLTFGAVFMVVFREMSGTLRH
jgi:hypothetical protein